MRRAIALSAAVVALTVGGCGSGHASFTSSRPSTTASRASTSASRPSTSASRPSTSPSASTSRSTTTSATSTRPRRPRPPLPAIGTTQTVHAHTGILSITVLSVIDPLTNSGAAALPGTRPVGVRVAIVDRTGSYDSSASGDWSLTLSPASADATPLFVKAGVCRTPLVDFESEIGAGETRRGCVGFSLPTRARLVSVRFEPHSRPAGSVSWR